MAFGRCARAWSKALRPARRLLHGEARLREPGPHEIAGDLVVVDEQYPRRSPRVDDERGDARGVQDGPTLVGAASCASAPA